ncbi:serine/threonine protein kinase [Candidatus Bathyarchaeota archaeon]|nr:MAG: serine/threonine protein kinase [Candidatus Bathyarchaeota archaeon]
MQQSETVPLKQLLNEKYGKIICYPRHDLKELKHRIKELKKLNVTAIEFTGEKTAFNIPVLGKGCVGIVVTAITHQGKAALKIRRIDADRVGMQHETEMLKKANSIGVGPRLLKATENFLLMEFIKGTLLPQWIETLKGKKTKSKVQKVLRAILEQCWRLDENGLDHGELSRAPKHIIIDVNDNPYLIDFETASLHRRVSNVTSICQFLFMRSQVAKMIMNKLGEINQQELVKALRTYKQQRTRENFEKILSVCGLHDV